MLPGETGGEERRRVEGVGVSILTGRGEVRTPLHPGGPHRCPHYAGPRSTERRAQERRGASPYAECLPLPPGLCLPVTAPIGKTLNMNYNKDNKSRVFAGTLNILL